eukprot:jgi/Pico_ML_1/53565/g4092.t1
MAQANATCVARKSGWMRARKDAGRRSTLVRASGPYAATVGDTKAKFYAAYPKPIPSVYNNVLLELLVQQHLYRFHKNYEYSPVFAAGFCSVFDQVMEGYEPDEVKAIFNAYINSLQESPEQYRNDATRMDAAAEASLDKVISHVGISKERVTSDLGLYKGILNKMAMAKELMQELVEREKKQQVQWQRASRESSKDPPWQFPKPTRRWFVSNAKAGNLTPSDATLATSTRVPFVLEEGANAAWNRRSGKAWNRHVRREDLDAMNLPRASVERDERDRLLGGASGASDKPLGILDVESKEDRMARSEGFSAAAVGMAAGMVLYISGQKFVPGDRTEKSAHVSDTWDILKRSKRRVLSIIAMSSLTIVFWAVYEQKSNTLALFEDREVGMVWIFLMIAVLTVGELFLSPIGLSFVSQNAPPQLGSFLMGVWFLASFAGTTTWLVSWGPSIPPWATRGFSHCFLSWPS